MLISNFSLGDYAINENSDEEEQHSLCPPDANLKLGWSNMPITDWLKNQDLALFVECPFMETTPNMHCCIPETPE